MEKEKLLKSMFFKDRVLLDMLAQKNKLVAISENLALKYLYTNLRNLSAVELLIALNIIKEKSSGFDFYVTDLIFNIKRHLSSIKPALLNEWESLENYFSTTIGLPAIGSNFDSIISLKIEKLLPTQTISSLIYKLMEEEEIRRKQEIEEVIKVNAVEEKVNLLKNLDLDDGDIRKVYKVPLLEHDYTRHLRDYLMMALDNIKDMSEAADNKGIGSDLSAFVQKVYSEKLCFDPETNVDYMIRNIEEAKDLLLAAMTQYPLGYQLSTFIDKLTELKLGLVMNKIG
jgi:hypothetical protein